MMFKNSIKLVTANFSTFWKMLLYKLIIILVVFGLGMTVYPVVEQAFVSVGFNAELGYYLSNYSILPNLIGMLRAFYGLINVFFSAILTILSISPIVFVYLIFLVFVLFPFLDNLAEIAFGECIYGYMSCLTKFSFVGSYIRKLKTSIVYAVLKLLFNTVLTALLVVGGYFTLKLITFDNLLAYFVPIILLGVWILLLSLKQTLLAGWMPAIVVHNDGVGKGFKQGVKTVSHRFFRTLSTIIVINFISMLSLYLFTTYSAIIIYPLYTLMLLTFQMVMFFGSHGMRYYVDMDTILTPQKIELYDKFNKVKHII